MPIPPIQSHGAEALGRSQQVRSEQRSYSPRSVGAASRRWPHPHTAPIVPPSSAAAGAARPTTRSLPPTPLLDPSLCE